MSAIAEKPRSSTSSSTALKREANELIQRASVLERKSQFDEASILYKRVVSLIGAQESSSGLDEELASLKRNANQKLMQSTLHTGKPNASNGVYQNMVRQLSDKIPQQLSEEDVTEMSEQVFEDPSAFEPVQTGDKAEASNATILFQLDSGARLFYLAKDGNIQTTSDTLPLSIYEVSEGGETCGLLKLGSWIYPLHSKISPSFKTQYDAYIFPNNTSVGEFVGLMFDETVQLDTRQFFEDVLSKYSVFMAQHGTPTYGESLTAAPQTTAAATGHPKLQEQHATSEKVSIASRQSAEAKATSKKSEIIGEEATAAEDELPYDTSTATGKLASALITGTKFLTKQLATGVVYAENFIADMSTKVHDSITPNPEPAKISRPVHATARGLRTTSGVAVKASSYVVNKVGAMTLALARTFAPNLGKIEKKTMPDGSVQTVKLSGIRAIGHSGVTSFAVIYESCENAAKHLATNLANESVSVVKHKYGEDASTLTENAAYAVGNAALSAYYVGGLGPKSIARKVVKQTVKQTAKNALT